MTNQTAYDFTFKSIDGEALPLSQFRGKVLLVVNTASKCGFTGQYKELEALYSRYKDKGLVILGVPSNDFGGQEPGKEAEIKSFCEVNFGVTFPLTMKQIVSGKDAHPFYLWAHETLGGGAAPKWNFHKYLVDKNGHLADWFSSITPPESPKISAKLEALLAAD